MTGDNIDELIGRLRKMAAYWNDNRLILEAADALEQQASEIGRLSRDLAAKGVRHGIYNQDR
jgi:hypothetical protein